MQGFRAKVTCQPMKPANLDMLHNWLWRPHVSEWWGSAPSRAKVEAEYLPMTDPTSTTQGYVAVLEGRPIGFIQSYCVLGVGGGWWEQETDSRARGIDQFLANADHLGRGLGSTMVGAFVNKLVLDASVTKLQTDPSPENMRAIRSYIRAGSQLREEVNTPDGPALLMLCYRSNKSPN